MRKIVCALLALGGVAVIQPAVAGPVGPVQPSIQQSVGGTLIQQARWGHGHHYGWSRGRHYGWARGHHYGWRHHRHWM